MEKGGEHRICISLSFWGPLSEYAIGVILMPPWSTRGQRSVSRPIRTGVCGTHGLDRMNVKRKGNREGSERDGPV